MIYWISEKSGCKHKNGLMAVRNIQYEQDDVTEPTFASLIMPLCDPNCKLWSSQSELIIWNCVMCFPNFRFVSHPDSRPRAWRQWTEFKLHCAMCISLKSAWSEKPWHLCWQVCFLGILVRNRRLKGWRNWKVIIGVLIHWRSWAEKVGWI